MKLILKYNKNKGNLLIFKSRDHKILEHREDNILSALSINYSKKVITSLKGV